VPAIALAPQTHHAVHNGRAFVLSELANTLANGSPANRYAATVFLREWGTWPDGFREMLEESVGSSDDRWLEVACALLASRGIPHDATVAEIMATPDLPGAFHQGLALALRKGASRDYPDRLIRRLLLNMPSYEWGASNTLVEFKDSPLVVRELTASLIADPSESIYPAWVLIRNGQHAFLQTALGAAVKLVSDSDQATWVGNLQASVSLLRDYGTDRQFDIIPTTLRRLKTANERKYRQLYSSVNYMHSKRELRVAAVVIDDYRPIFGTFRFCDSAASTVQKFSGEDFGIKREMTSEDRNRAVARATAWLNSHRNAL